MINYMRCFVLSLKSILKSIGCFFSKHLKRPNVIYGLLTLIICILSALLIMLIYNPTMSQEGVISVKHVLEQGPDSSLMAEYIFTYQQAFLEIAKAVDGYGVVHESRINDKITQLILDYPGWLEYYIEMRKGAWDLYQDKRVADGVAFPNYLWDSCSLIANGRALQNS